MSLPITPAATSSPTPPSLARRMAQAGLRHRWPDQPWGMRRDGGAHLRTSVTPRSGTRLPCSVSSGRPVQPRRGDLRLWWSPPVGSRIKPSSRQRGRQHVRASQREACSEGLRQPRSRRRRGVARDHGARHHLARAGTQPSAGDHKGPDGVLAFLRAIKERRRGDVRGGDRRHRRRRRPLWSCSNASAPSVPPIASICWPRVDFEIHYGKITEVSVYHADTCRFDEFLS